MSSMVITLCSTQATNYTAESVNVAAPITITSTQLGTAYQYKCANGQVLGVRYLPSDPQLKRDPVFVVLEYGGERYGLAPAVSGSGARYVGLSGPRTAISISGLEWWEHYDEAKLSRVNPQTGATSPLLTCRMQD